jgi:transcription antitermination factor NusG
MRRKMWAMENSGPSGGATHQIAERDAAVDAGVQPRWYVLQSKRHREQVAQAFLARRGLESYVPRIVQWPRPAVGSAIGAMFPEYVFVRAALPTDHYRVLWTPGVKAFVTFGEAPAAVDAGVIDFLRSRESADGVIRCDVRPAERSEVRIITGPFRGLTAIVEQRLAARDRVRVLMHLLQRETSVELPDRWVRQA